MRKIFARTITIFVALGIVSLTVMVPVSATVDSTPSSGDYLVTRYNTSSGDHDVSVRVGNSSSNYCEYSIHNDVFSRGLYQPYLIEADGTVLDTTNAIVLDNGEFGHWIIEPGAATPHSVEVEIEVAVYRLVAGNWQFHHRLHLSVYRIIGGQNRFKLGTVGSQPFRGC